MLLRDFELGPCHTQSGNHVPRIIRSSPHNQRTHLSDPAHGHSANSPWMLDILLKVRMRHKNIPPSIDIFNSVFHFSTKKYIKKYLKK